MNLKRAMQCGSASDVESYEKKSRSNEALGVLQQAIRNKNKKIRCLQQQARRKNSKITSLTTMMNDLKKRNLLTDDTAEVLDQVSSSNRDMIDRYIMRSQGKPLPKVYRPPIRSFALNLNFLSPKAYAYVRETFSTCLPHPRTLSRWYKTLNCDPGFTSESFDAIKLAAHEAQRSNNKLVVNIVFDEMAIRKQTEWDGQRSFGFVDVGDGGNSDIVATQVLVFMAVSINRSWKIPLGYFPITSLNATQKKQLILHCVENVLDSGAEVAGITFDGASVNLTAMKLLGCDLSESRYDYSFHLDNDDTKIAILPDPCHMLKLVRNALCDLKVFLDVDGNKVEWKYLRMLMELQDNEHLHLGNKLRKAHVYFANQKMKVRLAVQTMSKSVADAIDFCREVLQIDAFERSKPTTDFLRNFNDIFDVLNSRRIGDFGLKQALSTENISQVSSFADSMVSYIHGLKTEQKEPICKHRRKTGFIGIIACLKNVTMLHDRFLKTNLLKNISFYKLNQDHLELFFSSVIYFVISLFLIIMY